MTRPSIATARAEALFASGLPTDSRPNRAEATHAITTAVHRHGGVRGCAIEMAGAYGDRPESAARRMRWARRVGYALFDGAAPTNRATAQPPWRLHPSRGTPDPTPLKTDRILRLHPSDDAEISADDPATIERECAMHAQSRQRILTKLAATAALAAGMAGTAAGAAQASPLPEGPSALVTQTEVCSQDVEVLESDWDVETNCDVRYGDRVVIGASGSIKSGVWLGGWSGPNGWSWIAQDIKFPKPSAHSYALLARTDSFYRSIGTGKTFYYYGSGSHLYLRINDDTPGNGEGSFAVNVHVYR